MSTIAELNTFFSPWLAGLFFLVLGAVLGFVGYRWFRSSTKKRAQEEAAEIIQEAKDTAELRYLDEKERVQEIETELWAKEEKYLLSMEEKVEELEELSQEKKKKNDDRYSQERQKAVSLEAEIKKDESRLQAAETALAQLKNSLKSLNDQYVQALSQRIQTTPEAIIENIQRDIIQDTEKRALQTAESLLEETKEHSEQLAKKILSAVLDRFARPYCAERGIASVYFENPQQRANLADPGGKNVEALSAATGCDIIIEPEMELIGVAGYDPVRRELTRRLLERLLKEKKSITPEMIHRYADQIKKDLLRQIKQDGDLLAKELKLENLHPEIRQMMGSLRYRYSFTQNQYFHCAEVGWLCGLLASELRSVETKKGRRSGMLHDLGKAMDHELDGGHAVIGADFIEKRNEAPDIVHAVKAHHYDEQPATDLAYLVIAADAISGARPGARRSTIESYNQKVTELEAIARSFDGVTDCYILSGGRECRVLVNGKRVDDVAALKMSRDIATRIEAECNYPGQIKVVVVRETLVTESTRVHA